MSELSTDDENMVSGTTYACGLHVFEDLERRHISEVQLQRVQFDLLRRLLSAELDDQRRVEGEVLLRCNGDKARHVDLHAEIVPDRHEVAGQPEFLRRRTVGFVGGCGVVYVRVGLLGKRLAGAPARTGGISDGRNDAWMKTLKS